MNPTYLGIDFGTTKTLVSRFNEWDNKPQTIKLGRGRDFVPTSVLAEGNDSFIFGDAADDQFADNPSSYARAFKLKLGGSTCVLSYRNEKTRKRCTAAYLTQKYLEYILRECKDNSYACDRAVLTRPVKFTPDQLTQLEEAAHAAGLREVEFITEPQAAAYDYCKERPAEAWQNALVVDWGGGTLDMALVSKTEKGVVVHEKYCDGMLRGGEDFDAALFLLAETAIKHSEDAQMRKALEEDKRDPGWMLTTRVRIKQAKEALSRLETKSLSLKSCERRAYKLVQIKREDFEKSIMPDLTQAAKMAKKLIDSIQEKSLKPSVILLVGGSCKIPAVADALQKATGIDEKHIKTWDRAKDAVSLGAALYAHKLWGTQTDPPTPQREATPPPVTPGNSSDNSLYRKGVVFLYGIRVERDPQRAVQLFREGYAKGDFNAGYMLVACLAQGDGIARDYDEAFKIASTLAEKNFYPAYFWLSDAFAEGKGIALDLEQAEKYKKELIHYCSAPLPGVDESIRYNALMGCMAAEKEPDWRALEKVAQKNKEISDWPMRYGWLAMTLLRTAGESTSARRELFETLEAGCAENDVLSFWVKTLVQAEQGQCQEAQQTAKHALKIEPGFAPLRDFMRVNKGDNRAKQEFWKACALGNSAMERSNDLKVKIELIPPSFVGGWNVYKDEIAQKLLNKNAFDAMYLRYEPVIIIKNTNTKMLERATIRLCSADVKLDQTFNLNAIPPQKKLSFAANEFNSISYGEKLYVRVSQGERYSEMNLETPNGLSDFRSPLMPLMLTWESGLFGGYILQLRCYEGSLSNIVITKQSGATAHIPSLLENQEPATVGWLEFSDSASLTPQEPFTVQCDGFAPIQAMVLESVQNVADTFHPKGNFQGKVKGTTDNWYGDPQILEFYKKGAAAGDPESLYQLGCFYLHKGEKKTAGDLLRAAAGGGHSGAKTMLRKF